MNTNMGHFFGGVAQGMNDRRDSDRKDEALALEQTESAERIKLAGQKQATELRAEANKTFNDVLANIKETADALRAAGRSQDEIEAAVSPLAERAVSFGGRFGQDPELIAARIQSIAGRPAEPQTDLGKLEADRRAGYIDENTFRQKLEGLSKGNGTTINVGGAGEKSFATKLNQNLADEFTEQRKLALQAVQSITATDEALAIVNSGVIVGSGADYILQFGKALQQIGVNFSEDKISNTEAYIAARAAEVARVISQFGAGSGISDRDLQFSQKAAAGEITLTEQSIRKILEINARASRNIIKAYNNTAAQIQEGVVPFEMRLPEIPTAASDSPTTRVINGVTYDVYPDGDIRQR